MNVECLVVGNLETNCYILTNQKNQALIIDPGDDVNRILCYCKNYTVVGILVTHHHFDHIGALRKLEEQYQLIHNTYSGKDFSYEVLSFPGHTADSVAYYFPKEKMMFVGDFLFYHSFGRTDLGGNSKQMYDSLLKIQKYEDDILLYPGHGKSTILKEEKNLFSTYFQIIRNV